ncbi:hypothetical protein PAPYR_12509 [Paratrimastix pyriformis]|uniref:Uncharacterized protein n=1 Tax=Paratrimastix pyriformis TaxID=342808 RepID=A0ABQ8U499_9EUKA|nr:hypothetical protein PAPYR_12509 [Paratrimastix pyriformis]
MISKSYAWHSRLFPNLKGSLYGGLEAAQQPKKEVDPQSATKGEEYDDDFETQVIGDDAADAGDDFESLRTHVNAHPVPATRHELRPSPWVITPTEPAAPAAPPSQPTDQPSSPLDEYPPEPDMLPTPRDVSLSPTRITPHPDRHGPEPQEQPPPTTPEAVAMPPPASPNTPLNPSPEAHLPLVDPTPAGPSLEAPSPEGQHRGSDVVAVEEQEQEEGGDGHRGSTASARPVVPPLPLHTIRSGAPQASSATPSSPAPPPPRPVPPPRLPRPAAGTSSEAAVGSPVAPIAAAYLTVQPPPSTGGGLGPRQPTRGRPRPRPSAPPAAGTSLATSARGPTPGSPAPAPGQLAWQQYPRRYTHAHERRQSTPGHPPPSGRTPVRPSPGGSVPRTPASAFELSDDEPMQGAAGHGGRRSRSPPESPQPVLTPALTHLLAMAERAAARAGMAGTEGVIGQIQQQQQQQQRRGDSTPGVLAPAAAAAPSSGATRPRRLRPQTVILPAGGPLQGKALLGSEAPRVTRVAGLTYHIPPPPAPAAPAHPPAVRPAHLLPAEPTLAISIDRAAFLGFIEQQAALAGGEANDGWGEEIARRMAGLAGGTDGEQPLQQQGDSMPPASPYAARPRRFAPCPPIICVQPFHIWDPHAPINTPRRIGLRTTPHVSPHFHSIVAIVRADGLQRVAPGLDRVRWNNTCEPTPTHPTRPFAGRCCRAVVAGCLMPTVHSLPRPAPAGARDGIARLGPSPVPVAKRPPARVTISRPDGHDTQRNIAKRLARQDLSQFTLDIHKVRAEAAKADLLQQKLEIMQARGASKGAGSVGYIRTPEAIWPPLPSPPPPPPLAQAANIPLPPASPTGGSPYSPGLSPLNLLWAVPRSPSPPAATAGPSSRPATPRQPPQAARSPSRPHPWMPTTRHSGTASPHVTEKQRRERLATQQALLPTSPRRRARVVTTPGRASPSPRCLVTSAFFLPAAGLRPPRAAPIPPPLPPTASRSFAMLSTLPGFPRPNLVTSPSPTPPGSPTPPLPFSPGDGGAGGIAALPPADLPPLALDQGPSRLWGTTGYTLGHKARPGVLVPRLSFGGWLPQAPQAPGLAATAGPGRPATAMATARPATGSAGATARGAATLGARPATARPAVSPLRGGGQSRATSPTWTRPPMPRCLAEGAVVLETRLPHAGRSPSPPVSGGRAGGRPLSAPVKARGSGGAGRTSRPPTSSGRASAASGTRAGAAAEQNHQGAYADSIDNLAQSLRLKLLEEIKEANDLCAQLGDGRAFRLKKDDTSEGGHVLVNLVPWACVASDPATPRHPHTHTHSEIPRSGMRSLTPSVFRKTLYTLRVSRDSGFRGVVTACPSSTTCGGTPTPVPPVRPRPGSASGKSSNSAHPPPPPPGGPRADAAISGGGAGVDASSAGTGGATATAAAVSSMKDEDVLCITPHHICRHVVPTRSRAAQLAATLLSHLKSASAASEAAPASGGRPRQAAQLGPNPATPGKTAAAGSLGPFRPAALERPK